MWRRRRRTRRRRGRQDNNNISYLNKYFDKSFVLYGKSVFDSSSFQIQNEIEWSEIVARENSIANAAMEADDSR